MSSPSSEAPISNDLEFVAKGAYGCIIKPALPNIRNNEWQLYPKNVTKLFFEKDDMKKAYNDSKAMYKLLGRNKGHKTHKYKYNYRASNLPNAVRTRCKKIRSGSRTKLYPLRMPNLGLDVWNIESKYKKYRNIYVGTILDQILKVMKQIETLSTKGLIHGDVRETNIMIHPDTGVITLIDFDLLYPSDIFYSKTHLGFYCHPPETFLYKNIMFFMEATPAERDAEYESKEFHERLETYANHHSNFVFGKAEYLDRPVSMDDIKSALNDSIAYMKTLGVHDRADLRKLLLPNFDGYGFAFTLLEFLAYVYPSTLVRIQHDRYDSVLKDRIKDGSHKYKSREISIIRKTIHALVYDVLIHMVDLRLEHRLDIHQAVERAQSIIEEFHEDM